MDQYRNKTGSKNNKVFQTGVSPMAMSRVLGAVLLVVGILLLVFGLNATDKPVEELSNTFLGHYTDETMWYLVGGGAAAVAGILMVLFGGKRR
jgi:hypothetical protein